MDPELIDQVHARDEEHHRRRKADQEQRQAEQEAEADEAGPGLPERGRQIIMLARMVDDMARPEPAHAVRRCGGRRNRPDRRSRTRARTNTRHSRCRRAGTATPTSPSRRPSPAVSAPATVLPRPSASEVSVSLRLVARRGRATARRSSRPAPAGRSRARHKRRRIGQAGVIHRRLLTPVSATLPVRRTSASTTPNSSHAPEQALAASRLDPSTAVDSASGAAAAARAATFAPCRLSTAIAPSPSHQRRALPSVPTHRRRRDSNPASIVLGHRARLRRRRRSALSPSLSSRATPASARIASSDPPSCSQFIARIARRKRVEQRRGSRSDHIRSPPPSPSAYRDASPVFAARQRPQIAAARARAAIGQHRPVAPSASTFAIASICGCEKPACVTGIAA